MHKLLALGLGGVIVTAAALVVVGAWRSDDFSDRTADEVARMNAGELQRATTDVTRLVASVGDQVQSGVNENMAAAATILRQRGGLQLQERTATWTATNQFTQAKRQVTLPRVAVRGEWLRQNADQKAPTPLVDDIRAVLGGTVTVFQRMNDAGDLLRVATNVPSRTGGRAIGTYIPAVGADGTPNAVATSIRDGKPYRGVALVVDTWYISAYDPVKDASGRVIGALYFGVPQAEALANLTAAIADTDVNANGWVSVYSTAKADAGRVIASSLDGAVGQTQLDAADAAGARYVEQVVGAAPKLAAGQTFRATYRLPGATGAPAADTVVTVSYYAPYQWAIAVGGYQPDTAGALNAVRDGRRTMLLWFVIAALVLAVLGGAVAAVQARLISRRLGLLTGALSRLARRDLTAQVPAAGHDEIGQAGTALNTAAAELRGVLAEVTGAATEVQRSAGQVAANGAELATSAETASAQAGTASAAAGDISQHVRAVAAGAGEMGASIGEISGNAQEAAQAGRDGVDLARQAAGVVEELRRSTTQISDVVRLIASIAEQTNLLALNATIEAARAGDLGKGFAVVAGEVKELAQETARATDDVTSRVAAIEADTARAVEAIDAITATIGRVDSYQTAIAAAVEQQAATTAEMARTINEVATGSGDIAASIGGVSAATDTTHRAVDVSRRAADELNATAGRLAGLVGRFTV